jgi:beta-lactamase regulating signal transducer with metallopeptidase domain
MTAAAWIGTYLIHSTALIGFVTLFRRPLRRSLGGEVAWRAAMLLPVLSATAAQIRGRGLWDIGIAGLEATAPAASLSSGSTAFELVAAAAIVCFAVGVLLVLRDWVARLWFLRRLGVRAAVPEAVAAQLADLLQASKGGRTVVVTSAPGAVSAMVLGRGEICVPLRALKDLTPGQLRALIAHEMAHVNRSDGRWFTLYAVLESALFVQPMNRVARRELHHLAELSCDAWAASRVADPTAMAECLVEVAAWSRSHRPSILPAATVAPKALTERVTRLIEPPRRAVRVALLPCMLMLSITSWILPAVAVQPQVPAQHSSDYWVGFELGRAYAERNGVVSPRRDPTDFETTSRNRAELERRLQSTKSR